MFFVPFVTRLKRSQKFQNSRIPCNPEFIAYMLYMPPSFSVVFISLHKMTRWWQNYIGLHGENVACSYWLFALHVSQSVLEVSSAIHCLEIFHLCAIKTSVLYVPTEFVFPKHPPCGLMLEVSCAN